VPRLDRLSHVIALEICIVSEAEDPLLCLVRQAYLHALTATVRGLEAARVVLAQARHRQMR
jgi:hypothetical protein